jgi:hypothetical protein
MDRFAREMMRVQAALLETERQKVKLLLGNETQLRLREYALAAIADLKIVSAESEEVIERRRRRL